MIVEEAKEQDRGVLCQHPSPSPQFPPPSLCRHHCRLTVVCSSFCRRSRSRRHHKKLSLPTTTSTSSFEPKLEAVIDLTPLTAFQSELRRRFLSSGKDAYQDLQTLVTLDHNRRFSSWRRNTSSHKLVVVRRDRSLGGKEVVVAWGQRSDTNPLSVLVRDSVKRSVKKKVVLFQRKLPKCWSTVINSNASVINSNASVFDANEQEEYKREAYRVVRGSHHLIR
ncbi:uncharacterized protein LOC114378847 [Glycine soja]|uniref:uncharacterized protein LOC114378847 n=1 Tax=Glycine soja TaxID=3848 RepID=UPI00103B9738|nr:uncharacterized protein LOC114378847 [Glycine soja]